MMQGDIMHNNRANTINTIEGRTTKEPEIDYSHKTETLRGQILFGAKLFAIGGGLFLLFWLFEKYAGK
jgi:hypothetical protein